MSYDIYDPEDWEELGELSFDVPDVDFEYEYEEDEGCEGGACKI